MDSTHGRAGEVTLEEVERLLTPDGEAFFSKDLIKDGAYRTTIHVGFEPFDVTFFVKPSLGMYLVTDIVVRRHAPQVTQGESEGEDPHGAKARGVVLALAAVFPTGIPAGLAGKERDRQVAEWLEANGHSVPVDIGKAVRRALAAA